MVIDNNWAQITPGHWVHPDIGYIKFNFNKWTAIPKFFYKNEPRDFPSKFLALEWMQSLHKNFNHKR